MEAAQMETVGVRCDNQAKQGGFLGRFAVAPRANPQLMGLMRSSHGVPFFICAPRKTGRTSLALGYARRWHSLDEVLWMDASSSGFCEAIRSGTLVEHLQRQRVGGLARFSLIVFDDLPLLENRTATCFSDWIDHLIEEDVEIIIITTPLDDCLSNHQSDRLLISGNRLVASQKWNRARMTEALTCVFETPMPREVSTLIALMILMGRGIMDNLRELGYSIPVVSYTLLRQCCPFIEIDEYTGSFDTRGFPVEELKVQLLALLSAAVREEITPKDEGELSDTERCFERLTQLSIHLFERSECEQSQLLLELAGGLLAYDAAGLSLAAAVSALGHPTGSLGEPDENQAAAKAAQVAKAGEAAEAGEVQTGDVPAPSPSRLQHDAPPILIERQRPEALVVRLFGDFEIFRAGKRIEGENLHRTKVRTLMIHLALNTGCGVSRDTLMERIWPQKDYERARHNFHATWSRLSKLLANGIKPSPYLTNHRGFCKLEPSLVTTDVQEFEQLSRAFLFEQAPAEQRIELVYRLEQIYRGDILFGCRIDSYVQTAQQRYRAILVDVMLEASRLFSQEGNDTNAVWFARKAYDADPTREDVYRVLMAMQNRAGQRTNALQTYFDCKRFLSEELGILPSKKTTALYQELILDRR
jgi:DNA-binding SARP family transcriptional activator